MSGVLPYASIVCVEHVDGPTVVIVPGAEELAPPPGVVPPVPVPVLSETPAPPVLPPGALGAPFGRTLLADVVGSSPLQPKLVLVSSAPTTLAHAILLTTLMKHLDQAASGRQDNLSLPDTILGSNGQRSLNPSTTPAASVRGGGSSSGAQTIVTQDPATVSSTRRTHSDTRSPSCSAARSSALRSRLDIRTERSAALANSLFNGGRPRLRFFSPMRWRVCSVFAVLSERSASFVDASESPLVAPLRGAERQLVEDGRRCVWPLAIRPY